VVGCLALLAVAGPPTARAAISSAESPTFSYNVRSCDPVPGVRVAIDDSDAFPYNGRSCEPTPGVRTAASESPPAFMSYLPWDGTQDCTVNILDLIWVRNHLGEDGWSGESWRADANRDGQVNILDLIAVRNHLGVGCSGAP
jgi:hypothetical protein